MSLILERIVYVSDATRPDPALLTLADILAVSDRNNRRDGLTGGLLVTTTQFLQVLEGARQDLDRTLARIDKDPRHQNLRILNRHSIETRLFGNWTMVAARVTPTQAGVMNEIVDLSSENPNAACGRVLQLVQDQLRAA